MKKSLLNLFIIFFISTNLFSQTSVVDSILANVSLDSLKLFVRQLSGDTACRVNGQTTTIVSRNKNQPGNQLAAQYILEKFQSYGLTAAFENFSSTGNNVVGTKIGYQFPNRYYVVCAHYDDMPTGTLAPGADDNASGTAAVIEMARIFSKFNFPFTVKFLAFDEEEQGLIGSAYYAAQAKARKDTILGVINLDMIAYDGNNDGIINLHTKNVANTAEIVQDLVSNISAYNIGLVPVVVASQPYSDHDSFHQQGYGATLVIEDDNDFHPKYHTTLDNITYYNWNYFHKMAKMVAVTLGKYALNYKIILSHTGISFTNLTTPIQVDLQVVSGLTIGSGISSPRCYYRVNTGSGFGVWNYVLPIADPINNTYSFKIPGQSLGSTIEYYFAVQDQNGLLVQTLPGGGSGVNPPGFNPPPTYYSYFVANLQTVYNDNCDNISHWVTSSLWGISSSTYFSPPASITDSPSGTYPASTTNILTLKDTISFDSAIKIKLYFKTKYELEDKYDYVQFQVTTNFGQSWTPLPGKYTVLGTGSFQPAGQPLWDSLQPNWVTEEIDLTNYKNKNVQFRFYFKSDASVQKDGMYVDDFQVVIFNAGGTSGVTATLNINEGWNLLSVPLQMSDMSKTAIFPNAASNAYGYTNQYLVCDTLKNGMGYWVKFNNTFNHNINGSDIGNITIPVFEGWNLIGGINSATPVNTIITNPAGIISSSFYEYNGAYNQSVSIDKGKGYWVKVNQSGTLTINKVTAKPIVPIKNEKFDNQIKITDKNGKSAILYLSNKNIDLTIYEMPPLPPKGGYDIRFSSNSYVERLAPVNYINLTNSEFPVELEILSDKNDFTIRDEESKQLLGEVINNGKITIANKTGKISLNVSNIPTDFKVNQNFPNPFNPVTSIEYSIPYEGAFIVNIFNVTGEKIETLIDEVKKPGNYKLVFNASKLTSGIYFLQFKFDNKIQTIKSTLIK